MAFSTKMFWMEIPRSLILKISLAAFSVSSSLRISRMPPALPRPLTKDCAFRITGYPISDAACLAWAGLEAK